MPPKIIIRYELSDTLNNYSKNNIRKLYEYEGAVYYFDIHFYTVLLEDGYLSFNFRQANVVVLFQDKLIDFNIGFKHCPLIRGIITFSTYLDFKQINHGGNDLCFLC